MGAEPVSTPTRADTFERALEHACKHLGQLGYRLLDHHHDRRSGARLLVVRSHTRRELVFCDLRVERLSEQTPPDPSRRRRLRRAALAWLSANTEVQANAMRFDRLTVFVGRDGLPLGLEHEPQAF